MSVPSTFRGSLRGRSGQECLGNLRLIAARVREPFGQEFAEAGLRSERVIVEVQESMPVGDLLADLADHRGRVVEADPLAFFAPGNQVQWTGPVPAEKLRPIPEHPDVPDPRSVLRNPRRAFRIPRSRNRLCRKKKRAFKRQSNLLLASIFATRSFLDHFIRLDLSVSFQF